MSERTVVMMQVTIEVTQTDDGKRHASAIIFTPQGKTFHEFEDTPENEDKFLHSVKHEIQKR